MDKDFLKNLKAGDKVIVSDRYASCVRVVQRLTKTLIIVDEGDGRNAGRYNRNSGWLTGFDIWNSASLKEATQEKISKVNEENKRLNQLRKIKSFRYPILNNDQLDRIVNILNEER